VATAQSQSRTTEPALAGPPASLELDIPVLVDDMADTVSRAYNAWPNRLFVLSADGTVASQGARGPRGCNVAEQQKALASILEKASPFGSVPPQPQRPPLGCPLGDDIAECSGSAAEPRRIARVNVPAALGRGLAPPQVSCR